MPRAGPGRGPTYCCPQLGTRHLGQARSLLSLLLPRTQAQTSDSSGRTPPPPPELGYPGRFRAGKPPPTAAESSPAAASCWGTDVGGAERGVRGGALRWDLRGVGRFNLLVAGSVVSGCFSEWFAGKGRSRRNRKDSTSDPPSLLHRLALRPSSERPERRTREAWFEWHRLGSLAS